MKKPNVLLWIAKFQMVMLKSIATLFPRMAMTSIKQLQAQMELYKAQIEAYNAQVDAACLANINFGDATVKLFKGKPPPVGQMISKMSKQIEETMEKSLYDTLVNGWKPEYFKEFAHVKTIITIKEADNGFVAEINGGGIVVGKTLSETCEAAQQAVATYKLKNADDGSANEASSDDYASAKQAVAKGQPVKFKHNISASDPLGQRNTLLDKLLKP
ncbi:MAG TPA: hypothetical protein VF077_11690 [Nitrospiraceae bacterium]